jgi:hypothetical protein
LSEHCILHLPTAQVLGLELALADTKAEKLIALLRQATAEAQVVHLEAALAHAYEVQGMHAAAQQARYLQVKMASAITLCMLGIDCIDAVFCIICIPVFIFYYLQAFRDYRAEAQARLASALEVQRTAMAGAVADAVAACARNAELEAENKQLKEGFEWRC